MQTSIRFLLAFSALFFQIQVFAGIRVLFHPYDETFAEINRQITLAQETIDIAMYNIDVSPEAEIIKHLSSPEIQKRLASKKLQIRMLFQGSPKKSDVKLRALEALGMDVRYLDQAKKLHHKFALIDVASNSPKLITGSANWSTFSRLNYNENILFIENERALTQAFHQEYEELWALAEDYNPASRSTVPQVENIRPESDGVEVFFNSDNFKLKDGRFVNDDSHEGFLLTRKVVEGIENAKTSLKIATTRIKLRPVYDALLRAARRGVKIQILVSMDEYETKRIRKKKEVPHCPDAFDVDCSAGNNYVVFLNRKDFPAHENIDLRVKFFDMNLSGHLAKQMHSKYMIVDDVQIFSGSFNWSYSAEYNHLENLVKIDGALYTQALADFTGDFRRIFDLNRKKYANLQKHFEKAFDGFGKVDCAFEPLSMTFHEIDQLFDIAERRGKSFKGICR